MKRNLLKRCFPERCFLERCSVAIAIAAGLLVGAATSRPCLAQSGLAIDLDAPPIDYSNTDDVNRVRRLIDRLETKQTRLKYTESNGHLRALLAELEIDESSQVLVFSKTSLQVQHISRRNPRAIYFNDDTYVGWVRGSDMAEISTDDPKLGAAFYTVDMMPWRAKIHRADYDCLGCHATSMTRGVPGHTVRSVYPDFNGGIDSQRPSFVTSHATPIADRWGGWYVTGRHGDMNHLGNAFLRGSELDTSASGNRVHLRDDFDTRDYLAPYSDIVALMVLEHQTQTQSAMTKADFAVRKLLFDQSQRDEPKTADQSNANESSADETAAIISLHAREVVDELLFRGEVTLDGAISGSVVFADAFTKRGPFDAAGRSLRQFDLQTRMFKYPLSYLIYGEAFAALQPPLRDAIYRRLADVLNGEDAENFPALDEPTRTAIREILVATKPDFALFL